MRDINDIQIVDLLPESIKNDETVLRAAQAIQGEIDSLTAQIRQCLFISRINELDSDVLQHFAHAWSADYYRANLSLTAKRNVVQNAILVHQYKGTKFAVIEAFQNLGRTPIITEWWEKTPQGDPFTFDVSIDVGDTGIDQELLEEIDIVLESTKPVRAHQATRTIIGSVSGTEYLGAAVYDGITTSVYPQTA